MADESGSDAEGNPIRKRMKLLVNTENQLASGDRVKTTEIDALMKDATAKTFKERAEIAIINQQMQPIDIEHDRRQALSNPKSKFASQLVRFPISPLIEEAMNKTWKDMCGLKQGENWNPTLNSFNELENNLPDEQKLISNFETKARSLQDLTKVLTWYVGEFASIHRDTILDSVKEKSGEVLSDKAKKLLKLQPLGGPLLFKGQVAEIMKLDSTEATRKVCRMAASDFNKKKPAATTTSSSEYPAHSSNTGQPFQGNSFQTVGRGRGKGGNRGGRGKSFRGNRGGRGKRGGKGKY